MERKISSWIGLNSCFDATERKLLQPDPSFFTPENGKNEWMKYQKEKSVSYKAFKKTMSVKRSETKDTIYLQPLGDEFDTAKDARRPDLETVKSFMASYFYPLKVEILPVWKVDRMTDSSIVFLTEPGELECQVRRSQKRNSFSVSAPDIKRKLKASKNKLNGCICIVAITLLRLHSSHGAILGEATLSSGAAIVRCFGYSTQSTEDVDKIFRVCQLIAHETSHALGAPMHDTLLALPVDFSDLSPFRT